MKLNYKFAKGLKADGTPDYAPAVLRVETVHTEEWQECVNQAEVDSAADPETGESSVWPIYETRTREWRTYETKTQPSDEDYLKMKFKRVVKSAPQDPLPEGKHYEAAGWNEDESAVSMAYVAADDPLPAVADYDAAMEEHLRAERSAHGYTTREPDFYWNSEVPRWAQDARDWVAHRDDVMQYALSVMNSYASTGVILPLSQFKASLPTVSWTCTEET